jgi:hypothetical protein
MAFRAALVRRFVGETDARTRHGISARVQHEAFDALVGGERLEDQHRHAIEKFLRYRPAMLHEV